MKKLRHGHPIGLYENRFGFRLRSSYDFPNVVVRIRTDLKGGTKWFLGRDCLWDDLVCGSNVDIEMNSTRLETDEDDVSRNKTATAN